MSNLHEIKAKTAKITLSDGVERELRFTLNAMAEIEEAYGSVEEAFKALERNSLKAVRCVLWAGLLDSDPTLTVQRVGSLIDIANLQNIVEVMSEAFQSDMPQGGAAEASPNA